MQHHGIDNDLSTGTPLLAITGLKTGCLVPLGAGDRDAVEHGGALDDGNNHIRVPSSMSPFESTGDTLSILRPRHAEFDELS